MSIRLRVTALCCLLASVLAFTPAHQALAATVAVCPADETSLKTAITSAGAGGTVQFSCDDHITLTSTITIAASVTLDGHGHAVTLDGNHAVQVLTINGGVIATVQGLTIAHGSAGFSGGGINNNSTLTLTNSTLSGNSSSDLCRCSYNNATTTVINS